MSHLIYGYAECHYAECWYAECRYAECRGALKTALGAVFTTLHFRRNVRMGPLS
jgi:hypothetical protein